MDTAKISDQSAIDTIHPAMEMQRPFFPLLLNKCGFCEITNLLDHVHFSEPVRSFIKIVDSLQFFLVFMINIFDISQPVVHKPMQIVAHGSADAPATIMTADDHMFYLQMHNGIFE